jgi:hypothetical protein
MKLVLAIGAVLVSSFPAWADETCTATAKDKKLAGAALHSFMTKCERDATTKCNGDAKDKKLHGAANTSFVKKCVSDAKGA